MMTRLFIVLAVALSGLTFAQANQTEKLDYALEELDQAQKRLNRAQRKLDNAREAIIAAMEEPSASFECRHSVPTEHTRSLVGSGDSEQAAKNDYISQCSRVNHWSLSPHLCEIHAQRYMSCVQVSN